MTEGERNILQVMRYLDGQLAGEETAELSATLRRDAGLRDFLSTAAWQATTIADLNRSLALRQTAGPMDLSRRAVSPIRRLKWLIAACLLIVSVIGIWAYQSHRTGGERAQPTVLITSISGPVNWTSTTAGNRTTPEAGVRLGDGILETEVESASVQIQFDDGTTLTLGGASELAFSNDGRKSVRLKRGTVAAQVAKQSPGHPMILQTPTATLEVLGTVFNVTAQPEQTLLNVTQGRVRLRRLADGREVEVQEKQSTLASLDSASDLTPTQRTLPPGGFCENFLSASDRFRGTWLPATTDGHPARLAAVPYVAGRRAGEMIIHHGIVLRAQPDQNAGTMVALRSDSKVRVRFRTKHPASLLLLLITRKSDGGFGGNFERSVDYSATQVRPDGWRILEVPLTDFKPLMAAHADPAGCEVTKLLFSTIEKDMGLEVAEVTIAPSNQLKTP